MKMRPVPVLSIVIMALAGPSPAATYSLNAGWHDTETPPQINRDE